MNRLLLVALVAGIGLSACSKKEEAAPAPAAPVAGGITPPTQSALTPNVGKVLQAIPAGGYTYAEVETKDGMKVWIAGGAIQIKAGDQVQWGDSAVMQNFNSKTLNRTFDHILFVKTWGPVGGQVADVGPHGGAAPTAPAATPPGHPPMNASAAQVPAPAAIAPSFQQGEVKSVAKGGGYTYVEVKQGNNTLWLAAPETALKAGDKINWADGMLMRNFNAKTLGRTFDQIVFTDQVTVVK